MYRLNLSNCATFTSHRSGWGYVMSLFKNYSAKHGILLDGFIENAFSWRIDKFCSGENPYSIPYKREWIGFIHNPPNMPYWFDYCHSPQEIFKREIFQESLKKCKCLFVLSDYLKNYINTLTNIPVVSLKHPTEDIHYRSKWNPKKFEKNLIQLGYWLRKIDTIAFANTPSWKKIWFPSNDGYAQKISWFESQVQSIHPYIKDKAWETVFTSHHLKNQEYDEMLSKSVVLLNLYDSSANNAIIECIIRNTPIIVNKLPAVVEYLGENYPLYCDFSKESLEKCLTYDKIISSHEYLKAMNKEFLKGEYFIYEFYNKSKEFI